MDDVRTDRLRPHEVAVARDGARATVTVAVVGLHLRGAVEAGPPGTVRASGAAVGVPDPRERAVLGCRQQPLSVREPARRPDLRVAIGRPASGPADAGLPGPRLLRPTRRARRPVRKLRRRHPVTVSRQGLPGDAELLAVVRRGEAALVALALRAGPTRQRVAGRGDAADTSRNGNRRDRTLLRGVFDGGEDGGVGRRRRRRRWRSGVKRRTGACACGRAAPPLRTLLVNPGRDASPRRVARRGEALRSGWCGCGP
ncbi:hypothetical protein AB0M97_27915, partial [Streptomyces sp. NPDC051207]|uniref:hypothetical protein n=1 Tax=Streptomyces sp. NPDC051207 TaxID=3154641 RepID=UPI0034181D96